MVASGHGAEAGAGALLGRGCAVSGGRLPGRRAASPARGAGARADRLRAARSGRRALVKSSRSADEAPRQKHEAGRESVTTCPEPDPNRSTLPVPPAQAMPAGPDAQLPLVDPHRYVDRHEHARGGLGLILAAHDTKLRRSIAIKVPLAGEDGKRFVEEALLTASLQHPAIVPVYDAGWWTSGQPFFSMKMVEGSSLRDAIERARTLEQRVELLPSVIAVADAIAYAHGKHVIHRDLKPSNILIGPFG